MELADILDTYIIRVGIQNGQYGYATAVGLMQGVIGLILVVTANELPKSFLTNQYGNVTRISIFQLLRTPTGVIHKN